MFSKNGLGQVSSFSSLPKVHNGKLGNMETRHFLEALASCRYILETVAGCLFVKASPPLYVTLHIKIGWRNANICGCGSGKWCFHCIFGQFAEAGKKRIKAVHLLEESVINMIGVLLPVLDWPIIMIGPGGLLLVVPTYYNPDFSFMCGVAEK